MKKTVKIYLIGFFMLLELHCKTYDFILTFFIRNYPEYKKDLAILSKKSATGKLSYHLLKQLHNQQPNQGIIATYFGFNTISSDLGQITFPRLVQKPLFHLLITPILKPIFMIGNTIAHWEIIPGMPAQLFSVALHQDTKTKLWYWKVQQEPLPTNNIVTSKDTITIFAKPKYIFIPEGITITTKSQQLILPNIYAKEGISSDLNALGFLNIRAFFRSLSSTSKKQSDIYYSTIINDNP